MRVRIEIIGEVRQLLRNSIYSTNPLLKTKQDIEVLNTKNPSEYGQALVNKALDIANEMLIHTARHGELALMKEWMRVPLVDFNSREGFGYTALMGASSEGHIYVVNALISSPVVNVNAVDSFKQTALMFAVNHHHVEVVKALLTRSDLNLFATNKHGKTVLQIAQELKHHDIIKLLEEVYLRMCFRFASLTHPEMLDVLQKKFKDAGMEITAADMINHVLDDESYTTEHVKYFHRPTALKALLDQPHTDSPGPVEQQQPFVTSSGPILILSGSGMAACTMRHPITMPHIESDRESPKPL